MRVLMRQADRWRAVSYFLICILALTAQSALALDFDVASIRPSSGAVEFERNGRTEFDHGALRMHDVTIQTCIDLAYAITPPLLMGPPSLKDVHYDILAKANPDTTNEQMRMMMRTMLRERFNLAFHMEKKEMRVYTLKVAKSGIKMRPAVGHGEMVRENNATGMVARSISMQELAEYLSDPVNAPLVDETGLAGRYDLTIDFTPYVNVGPRDESEVRPNAVAVMKAALKGELGLEIVQDKRMVDVMVVDHVEAASAN